MKTPFSPRLEALSRIRGVVGALVVGESDGLVVDAVLQSNVRGEVVAALAASLYRRTRLAAKAAGLGTSGFLQLDAEQGRICATGVNDLVLVTIAESHANAGMIRSEMMRGHEAAR